MIPLSDTGGVVDYVSVHRPDNYCAYIFADIMNRRGIKFKGEILRLADIKADEAAGYSIDGLRSLFVWESDSLGLVISVINKNSQNFFAEQTLKTMGAELGGEGSFEKGLEMVRVFFDSLGIGKDDLGIYDGSGLSHHNMATPLAIIRLFRKMYRSPNFEVYYESLAIPGIDRSVRKRLEGVEFRERARTKTGSIVNVRDFSGYIDGPHTGRLFAFSMMVNSFSCESSYVEDWFDSVTAVLLSEF
jgi:D-alanyl-D-alanine carboxypeptidase/D-alanyl-D-alanine-endopeptidase (penicillin-binding protein 4)